MNHRANHTPKTCHQCGNAFHRRPDEKSTNYTRRKTCSPECARQQSAHSPGRSPKATPPHAPCVTCTGPVMRRADERLHRYRERKTCGRDECIRAALSSTCRALGFGGSKPRSTTPEALRARARRRDGVAERRVAFDRFPIPEGGKPTWVTVTGEGLPPVNWNNTVTRTTLRPPNLADALDYHPDLRAALAGLLTDSWVPFSRGSGFKMHAAADAT